MKINHLIWLIFIDLQCSLTFCENYENQPKIYTKNGHLYLESATNRSITIKLTRGTFKVNDWNVVQMLQKRSQSTFRITQLEYQLSEYNEHLKALEEIQNTIESRLDYVEELTGNLTINYTRELETISDEINEKTTLLTTSFKRLQTNLERDNCWFLPCDHGGTCINGYESFICLCPKNWEGPNCRLDVDECEQFKGTDLGCTNGATCTNTPGGYMCHCAHGFSGLHCRQLTNRCEFSGGSSAELCGHGYCVQTTVGYKCVCDQGWTKDSNLTDSACVIDVDECQSAKVHCSRDPPVDCVNLEGSFRCGPCPQGYTGNGHWCVDLNECDHNNGGCSRTPTVKCHNIPGSYHCDSCPLGYQGDGVVCDRLPRLCANFLGCHPLATCDDHSNRISCRCPTGYNGTGFGEDGCRPIPRSCTTENPCLNNGNCSVLGQTLICSCPYPYVGTHCQEMVDLCAPNTCQNGGRCRQDDARTMKYCLCSDGFAGIHCQNEVRECGGSLSEAVGTLNFTASHRTRRLCMWTIQTNLSLGIRITFSEFRLGDYNVPCRRDYLEIYDGADFEVPTGRICGDRLPFENGTFVSVQNTVMITLRADELSNMDGFSLSWQSVEIPCSQTIQLNHNDHGTLESPGYPRNYPPNIDCRWYLRVPHGKGISFHLTQLALEQNLTCGLDYLSIDNDVPFLSRYNRRYCKSGSPTPLMIPTSSVIVHFHSNGNGSDKGFQLSYVVTDAGCGGEFRNFSGEFHSPSVSHPICCDYLIEVAENMKIRLNLIDSHDKPGQIEVFDGLGSHIQLTMMLGNKSEPVEFISKTNQLLVRFQNWKNAGFHAKFETICYYRYEDMSGQIELPNIRWFPFVCDFFIIAPREQKILLQFIDFNLAVKNDNNDCSRNRTFVQVIDEGDPDQSKVKYCQRIDDEFISFGDRLTIHFESDHFMATFKVNYTFVAARGCGGLIRVTDNGTIHASVLDALRCRWDLKAVPGYVIHFERLELRGVLCENGYVQIFDNVSKVVATPKYCNQNIPSIAVTTTGEIATIWLIVNGTGEKTFSLEYSLKHGDISCGGHYSWESGIIQSPGWPEKYLHDRQCEWFLTAPAGRQILLHFNLFELEHGCVHDYLEIKPNQHSNSTIFGRFCGQTIPEDIISYSNQLYLKFVSDGSVSYHGFQLEYISTATGCGGRLTSYRGEISSPNYPELHSGHLECIYQITISHGSRIRLTFIDLDIGEISSSDCVSDYIEIDDGANKKIYCNTNPPGALETTSNTATITYISEGSSNDRGFRLAYETICHVNLTGLSGTIESPNYPKKYPLQFNCAWLITAPLGNRIKVEFSDFYIHRELPRIDDEGLHKCIENHLTITTDLDNGVGQKYCDLKPPGIIISSSNLMLIEAFVNLSRSVRNDHFRLEYIVDGCVGVFRKPVGNISSPNYPHPYPLSTVCNWTIEAPNDEHSIEVTIEELDIQQSSNCVSDGLFISNYPSFKHLLGQYCTHTLKQRTIIGGHKLFVSFVSDNMITGRGFKLNYKFIPKRCGQTYLLTGSHGGIYSPNYPAPYPSQITCEWLIKTDEHHTIAIEIIELELEFDPGCQNDRLLIYEGPERDPNRLLRQLCNHTVTKNLTITSNTNQVRLIFESNDKLEFKGFALHYRRACGGTIYVNGTDNFQLSNQNELDDSFCVWYFFASEPTQRITFTLTHLSGFSDRGVCLETDSQIRIFDGLRLSDDGELFRYCGQKVHPIQTTEPTMVLTVFHSNQSSQYMSRIHFTATYSVFETFCGGVFQQVHGVIASPNYPRSYPLDHECVWELRGSPGSQLQVISRDFDIMATANGKCDDAYLELRDSNENGRLLGIYCNLVATFLVMTNMNGFWVKFRSSTEITGKGFQLEYNLLKDVELTGTDGQITSPLYPNIFYDKSVTYTWRIIVPYGSIITLRTLEFYTDRDENCISWVRIYDGYDRTGHSLAEDFCGDDDLEATRSTSNVLFIELQQASYSRLGTRFRFEWKQINQTAANDDHLSSVAKNCGTIFKNGTRELFEVKVNGTGGLSDPSSNCEWIFTPHFPLHHAEFDFHYVSLMETQGCVLDYIEIFSSRDLIEWTPLSGRLCPSIDFGERKYHGNPYLKIDFIATSEKEFRGFSGMYVSRCGQEITSMASGIIETSPDPYNWKCDWNVTVKPGKTIQLTFEEFRVNKTREICEGSIILRNGFDADSPYLGDGIYCSDTIPMIPQTSGNRVSIQLRQKNQFDRIIFKLRFEEISLDCDNSPIILTNQMPFVTIRSPNYPNIPQPFTECFWRISVPSGEMLMVEFLGEFAVDCHQEYVEVREGGTTLNTAMERFCGVKPQPMIVPGNIISVKYFTETPEPNPGFRMNISMAGCNRIHRATYGAIQYAEIAIGECDHLVIGPKRTKLTISITAPLLDVTPTDCTNRIEVYWTHDDLNGTDSILLDRNCIQGPHEISIPSNMATIKFFKTRTITKPIRIIYNATDYESSCNGDITAESGEIVSPGYPHLSPMTYCSWKITVPKGRRIKFESVDFDLPTRGFFFYIADGDFHPTPLFIDDNFSEPQYSSNNLADVSLSIWTVSRNRGLKIRFTSEEETICVGDLDQREGVLRKLNVTTDYNCEYIRTRPFRNDSQHGTMCLTIRRTKNLYLRIYDAEMNRQLDNPDQLVQTIRTIGQGVRIVVSSDDPNDNYTIEYKVHKCGGKFFKDINYEYIVRLPNFTRDYGRVDCAWLITVDQGEVFRFNLTSTRFTSSCEEEYINVYQGDTVNDPHIGKYCGQTNVTFVSHRNKLLFEYHADAYDPSSGFEVIITPEARGCGGILHHTAKYLVSPPTSATDLRYPNNAECLWEIFAKPSYHIDLEFYGRFQLEASSNCTRDYVEVFDDRTSMGRFCGRQAIGSFIANGSKMTVKFRSDAQITGDGFKAFWRESCGSILKVTSKVQYIMSPNYPDKYSENLLCNYTVKAPKGQWIELEFVDLDLEGNSGMERKCFDYVAVHSTNGTIVKGPFCGSIRPTPIHLQMGDFVISFISDPTFSKRGFKLSVRKSGKCIKTIMENDTRIEFVDKNPTKCSWKIVVEPERKAIIEIVKLSFGGSNCDENYLKIIESGYPHQRICESLRGFIINFQSPFIKLQLDASAGAEMILVVQYKKACDHTILLYANKSSESIRMLSPESGYENQLDCYILVGSEANTRIRLTFESFHIAPCENQTSCSCDFVEIRDGPLLEDPQIGSYCGHDVPPEYTSSGSELFIRFVTDGKTVSTGFSAKVEMVPSPCGQTHFTIPLDVTKSVTIESPGSPLYPPNLKCTFLLFPESFEDEFHKMILLEIEHIDLEESEECSRDYLEITGDGVITSSNTLDKEHNSLEQNYRFCGRKKPPPLYSVGRIIRLVFETDGETQQNGFKVVARRVICITNYTELYGRIRLIEADACEFQITVPRGYMISLYVMRLKVFHDGIEIFEGDKNGPLLATLNDQTQPFTTIYSTTNSVFVQMGRSQFNWLLDMTYIASSSVIGCGGELFDMIGILSSPHYGENHRQDSECRWNITVPHPNVVRLTMIDFQLGSKKYCADNYYRVIDGDGVNTFCGGQRPAVYRSKGNSLTVEFRKTVNFEGIGFMVKFEAARIGEY